MAIEIIKWAGAVMSVIIVLGAIATCIGAIFGD